MPGKAFVGRVGGLAVAVGVGAAIVTGWSSGLAWADESGGTAGSTTTSGTEPAKAGDTDTDGAVTKDAPAPTTKKPQPTETATPPESAADDEPTGKPRTSKGSDAATPKPPKKKTPAPVSTVANAKHDATAPANTTRDKTTVADPQERTDDASLRTVTTQTLSNTTQRTALTTEPTPKAEATTDDCGDESGVRGRQRHPQPVRRQ